MISTTPTPVPLFSPAKERGVETRWQCRSYARLQWISRRQARCGQFRGLIWIILPVVIRDEERSVLVTQLQRWIGQRVRHTKAVRLGPIPRMTICLDRRCQPG